MVNGAAGTTISRFLAEDRQAVGEALATIGESLARFAARCVAAGADGIFLSVRDDWVDTPALDASHQPLTDLRPVKGQP